MMQEIAVEFDTPISGSNPTSRKPDEYWVALNQEIPIGTIGLIIINEEFGILKNMMLKKAFRGKELGVSNRLLHTAIDWCLKNNIKQIYLGTMDQFKAAQIFYKRHGFYEIKENHLPPGFLNNPIDKVFFCLNLGTKK